MALTPKRKLRAIEKNSNEKEECSESDSEVSNLSTRTPSKREKFEEEKNNKSSYAIRKKAHEIENDNTTDEEITKIYNKKRKGKKDIDNDKDFDEKDTNSSPKNKKKIKAAQKKDGNEQDSEEYEVSKIVDQRTIKGRRQFLVQWKGYSKDSNTWEQEKELNCDRLIEEFLAEQEENNSYSPKDAEKKIKKTPSKKIIKKIAKPKDSINVNEKVGKVDSKEYEVYKIIDVHFKKNKSREFLIRWKGFSSNDDTWEPEEHLNCPELINKFMDKLKRLKNVESHELRANPSHTKHFIPNTGGKKKSRRYPNKTRTTYYEDNY